MILSQLFLSLALSSAVTPGALAGVHFTNQGLVSSNNNVLENPLDWRPTEWEGVKFFDKDTFVRSEGNGYGDFYAYYGKGAYQNYHGGDTYGYVISFSKYQLQTFIYLRDWAKENGKHMNGSMISYITDEPHYNTPWRGGWTYYDLFEDDSNVGEREAITYSFTDLGYPDVYPFLLHAWQNDHTVTLYFFTEQDWRTKWGHIVFVNETTGATLETQEHENSL